MDIKQAKKYFERIVYNGARGTDDRIARPKCRWDLSDDNFVYLEVTPKINRPWKRAYKILRGIGTSLGDCYALSIKDALSGNNLTSSSRQAWETLIGHRAIHVSIPKEFIDGDPVRYILIGASRVNWKFHAIEEEISERRLNYEFGSMDSEIWYKIGHVWQEPCSKNDLGNFSHRPFSEIIKRNGEWLLLKENYNYRKNHRYTLVHTCDKNLNRHRAIPYTCEECHEIKFVCIGCSQSADKNLAGLVMVQQLKGN